MALSQAAHVVVYERAEGELLTIYDCGVAQKPPSAQLLGTVLDVEPWAEIAENPTGRAVRTREVSTLVAVDDSKYRITT